MSSLTAPPAARPLERVCIVGSGNWGSAIAKIVGENTLACADFEDRVNMWVYEEQVDGQPLTQLINTHHENVKYLPGIPLPHSVVAMPDLVEAATGATLLVFVLPHQFLPRLLPQLRGVMAPNCLAISLIKGGIAIDPQGRPSLISDTIRQGLGVDCSVLMGANVANEVAEGQFCETTIGCVNQANGAVFHRLFNTPTFRVSVVGDEAAVELSGALKNIVALGAGFCDGLGFGTNTKSAVMRIGLAEMMQFTAEFFGDRGTSSSTFFESCGIADLITTCFGGRNRKCAEEFARTGKSWDVIEAELLNGQRLQGTLTAEEVHQVLAAAGRLAAYPFFVTVYRIAYEGLPAERIVKDISP